MLLFKFSFPYIVIIHKSITDVFCLLNTVSPSFPLNLEFTNTLCLGHSSYDWNCKQKQQISTLMELPIQLERSLYWVKERQSQKMLVLVSQMVSEKWLVCKQGLEGNQRINYLKCGGGKITDSGNSKWRSCGKAYLVRSPEWLEQSNQAREISELGEGMLGSEVSSSGTHSGKV